MHFKITAILILFISGLFLSIDADAQKKTKYNKGSKYKKSSSSGGSRSGRFRQFQYLGFNINALNYYGDLAPASGAASTDISFTRPGFFVSYME